MKRKPGFYLRRVVGLLLFFMCVLFLANFSLIIYGLGQLRGQLHILFNSRPINEMLTDTAVSDSLKWQLKFIEEVKKFAIDSLGLKASKNYTTFYDQQNKPILWVLTASDPYKIQAYQWKFPLLGSVSYKGFFDFEKGREAELEMIEQGYDTDFDDVSAWSTLGWFKDPVLSGMLKRGKGQLAELIIHELTHATLYLKSNVDKNENLASVCGEQGAERFLESKYGFNSIELMEYINQKRDYELFSKHMLRGTHLLDSVYQTIGDSLTIYKKSVKDKMILAIVSDLDTITFYKPHFYGLVFKKRMPNNAYFLNFVRYDAQKDRMKEELTEKFNGNIRRYIDSLRD